MNERPSRRSAVAVFAEKTLISAGPRWLLALVGEVSGAWPIQKSEAGFFKRMRGLLGAKADPHPLFDPSYYSGSDGKAVGPPLLHFLIRGGHEGRKPHPLFDPAWYLMRYPDVARARYNPLQHYINYGWKEGRSPHPLFDPKWYWSRYPETKSSGQDPLVDFLLRGGGEGRKPHPLFDSAWYLQKYPEVKQSRINPLVHYVMHGATEGANPNPRFDTRRYQATHPEAAQAGMDPLSHLVIETYTRNLGVQKSALLKGPARPARELTLKEFASKPLKSAPVWRNRLPGKELAVFVVYGRPNVAFIESHLIPALAAQEGPFQLRLHTLHYKNPECLLSAPALAYSAGKLCGVTDWSAGRADKHIGFGEGVNYLFEQVKPESCFLIVNPDSIPMAGCIDQLLTTFTRKPAALVEAHQWPMDHPKEFNKETGETPWASGAFLLAASDAFQKLKGFDPIYFLYNEDVDLSWRAWLEGMPVVYEPAAMCAHFTGALGYDSHEFQYEQFFSIRNFLLIAYKFFGERGEQTADSWIREANLPASLYTCIKQSYLDLRGNIARVSNERVYHPEKIKILGMNLYHELRKT